jgi:hypothetical protein
MKKVWVAVLLVAFLGTCAVVMVTALPRSTPAGEPSTVRKARAVDVVMMRCRTTGDFPVVVYRGSSAAPTKRSESCPESLAQLFKEGFSIRDVGYSEDAETVIYTLKR